ncbi:MAG: C39 family peptidase [Spirochaetes bacterium]|nr:C39 family peptidase [Spirochaetota bacterium]
MKILFILLLSISPLFSQIENVPFVRQKTHYCGPAALSSVMGYYGVKTDQKVIGKAVYSEKIQGTLITDLENFAREKKFSSILATGTTNDVKKYIDRKRPVLVLVDVGIWMFSMPHYLVVFGYNAEGFIAHTGYASSKLITYDDFIDYWNKMGNVYLIVYKDKKP